MTKKNDFSVSKILGPDSEKSPKHEQVENPFEKGMQR